MEKIAIMLNTCDKFCDLWPLFFDCLYRFWNPNYRIYLNTESLDYKDDRFEIISIHPSMSIPWSNRLYNCVKNIEEDYILCIEDECLIEEPVNVDEINHAISIMESLDDAACIWLMHIEPDTVEEGNSYLPFVERSYDYRTLICQQVCLWRKEKWLKYIKPRENPWEYECLGSARGKFDNDRFFVVDSKEPEVIKYGYGFIVYRGYWCKEEKERLEKKLGLSFNDKARQTKSKNDIERITNKDFWFYNRLRIKKRLILLNKRIFHKSYNVNPWENIEF